MTPSPVKALSIAYNLAFFQPKSLKEKSEQEQLANFNADIMIVAAYGMLLPAQVLTIPPLGCINIHPSLLPRWRGAAPIQRTIYAGDTESGVTIMQMDPGLDTGPILLQQRYKLKQDETSQTLHDTLAKLGSQALLETLELLKQGKIFPEAQDNHHTTYAEKISKEEALIDWHQSALELEQAIRAFNPWPVAYTSWQGKNLRIWMAKTIATVEQQATPRTILYVGRDGIDIATGKGVLRLLQVQLPGAKILSIADFYNAYRHKLLLGEHLV
jgi:methionyl-tRNA formyltransferase